MLGNPRPRRDHDVRRGPLQHLVDRGAVVANDLDRRATSLEQMSEVPGERVVVVEKKDAACRRAVVHATPCGLGSGTSRKPSRIESSTSTPGKVSRSRSGSISASPFETRSARYPECVVVTSSPV